MGRRGQVVKHGGAVAHNLSQVFVGVGGGVPLLQQLCVVQEALAQPFRRGCQVGGVVLELPRAALPLVSVDPMAGHGGGVEGLKRKRKRAAAEDRLFNVTDFLRPVVLVEFLKVENPEIPERHGQGFQLPGSSRPKNWIVCPVGMYVRVRGLRDCFHRWEMPMRSITRLYSGHTEVARVPPTFRKTTP